MFPEHSLNKMSDFRFIEQRIVHASAQKPGSEGSTPNNSIILPQKHPKAKRACNACRRGKSRCDGRRPSCSRCASKGTGRNCVYEMETMKTQQYITFLENRVLELESRAPIQTRSEGQKRDNCPDKMSGTDEGSLAKTDALVMVPSQERKPSEGGGSSVTAFLHSISNSIGLDDSRDKGCQFNVPTDFSARNTHQRKVQAEISPLPPRRTADALMTKFWIYIHPIFPVLDKEQTELSYQSLWGSNPDLQNPSEHDGIERAIFNIIFALGCQTGSEEESADHFYQASRESYAVDAIDLPSLKVVQLLVLTGVYLQSTKYASRCWTIVGMAIRYAQYLGIDAKEDEQASCSDISHAIRHRVWYSCVILDRLLSLSFNNSSMTPPQNPVDLSMLIPGHNCGSQTTSQERHRLAFFVHSSALFEIVNDTLVNIYHSPPSDIQSTHPTNRWWPREQLQRISAQNQALDDLSVRLPDYLNPSCDARYGEDQPEDGFRWQSYVFRSRFLYVRILVLRPLLLSAASASVRLCQGILSPGNTGRATVEENNARSCCTLCIDTLQHLVAHMSERLERRSNFARWREFHYSFVCAIAISVARLCYLDSNEFALHDSWARCLKILDHYKPRIQSAQRAMDMLHRLDARVTQLTKDTGRTSTPPLEAFFGNEQAGSSLDSLGLTPLIEGSDPLGGLNPYDIDYAWLNSQAGSWGWFDH